MRIDEFSNAADIDSSITTTEQAQFLLFGFDIALDAPLELFYEDFVFVSSITKYINFNSFITTATATFSFFSIIIKKLNFNSKLDN